MSVFCIRRIFREDRTGSREQQFGTVQKCSAGLP